MTYEESAQLMTDPEFRGRIKVAVVKYADSIVIEAPTVPGHASRYRWATSAFQQPDMTAAGIQPQCVMDAQVQTDGAGISDPALQTVVETTVNKII